MATAIAPQCWRGADFAAPWSGELDDKMIRQLPAGFCIGALKILADRKDVRAFKNL
jgi:hypothetical protein